MLTGVKHLFLDTNILIYSSNTASPWHAHARLALQRIAQPGIRRCISTQSLREYFASATRALPNGTLPSMADALRDIAMLQQSYTVLADTHAVSNRLFTLVAQTATGGRQIHDANIVATMLTYGVTHLVTHNVSDFARFAAHITILPLAQLGQP